MTANASGLTLLGTLRDVRSHIGQTQRYAHSLRVARFAERLAVRHGVNPAQARLAGIYHDLARLYSTQRLLTECAQRGMSIDTFERAHPIVLHARLGAEVARERYGVEDEAVLSAIRKHTVAAGEMSRLDTILYLADSLEPGRSYPERAELAALALADLDAAIRAVLSSTVTHLQRRNAAIAPQTLAAAQGLGVSLQTSVSGQDLERNAHCESQSL